MLDVIITISGRKTGETYLAKSYPHNDFNKNGRMELYETPVYKVFISTEKSKKEWKALRFMPYYNDPKSPSSKYGARGWINSGLRNTISKKAVTFYNPAYGTINRYSPYSGGIQITRNFLIHAGPQSLVDTGWGAAGCVEIIGNFDNFKDDINKMSGLNKKDAHEAIKALVKAKKLFVKVEYAPAPKLKSKLKKEVEIPRHHNQ